MIAHIKRSYWVLATVLAFLGAATFFARWWAATDTPGYSRLGKANPAPQALAETKPLAVRVTGELAALNAVDVRSTLAGSVSAIRFKTGERVPANSIVAMVEAQQWDTKSRGTGSGASESSRRLDEKEGTSRCD